MAASRTAPTPDRRRDGRARRSSAMAKGGIYDQVGGGFARYSVDAHWLVPHFEKMLYDNALLARAYLHAWQLTGEELFRRVCEETLDWALREMRGPEGGFYSALDADSEGEEGKFYVWTRGGAARCARRRRATRCSRYWGVDRGPNFEGRSILHVVAGTRSTPSCSRGRAQRCTRCASRRVWPGLDDKRLTAWNALMMAALADAGAVLGRADYLDAARRVRAVPARADARRRRPPAAHLQGRPRLAERLPRGPRLPARGAAGAVRGDVRDALVRRGARDSPTTIVRGSRDPRAAAASSTPPPTTRRWSCARAASRTTRSRRATPPPRYALLRIWRRSRATAPTSGRRSRCSACSTRPRPRHPQAFGHLLQAMRLPLLPRPRGGAGRRASSRSWRRSCARGSAPRRAGRDAPRRQRGARGGAAAAPARACGRALRRVRVRELRLPDAGDRRRRAGRAARVRQAPASAAGRAGARRPDGQPDRPAARASSRMRTTIARCSSARSSWA